jgi:hypothetical protein
VTTHLAERDATSSPQRIRRPQHSRAVKQALAFLGAAGVMLVYALHGGGSYDLVTFEEQGLVIWCVLAMGIGLGLLPRRRPSRAMVVLLAALAAYAAWTGLSLVWTQSAELTTEELARSLDYLGIAAAAVFVLDRDNWRAAAGGLGFAALLVCVIAVGSRLAPAVFGVDHVDAALRSDRLSYPFGYWNAMAAWGAMCIALGIVWSAHDPSRVRRGVSLALVPVAATMTYLTYSRAGVGGASLAVVAAIALSRSRLTAAIHAAVAGAGAAVAIIAVRSSSQIAHATGTRRAGLVLGALVFAGAICAFTPFLTRRQNVDRFRAPPRIRRPLRATVIVAVLVAGAAVGPGLASRAWHSFKQPPIGSTTDPTARLSGLAGNRYVVWKSAIKAFDTYPAGGTGAGTFEFWWNQHGTNIEFIRDTHNIWLENLAELGVPGLLLIVAAAAAAVGVAVTVRVRARRAATAGAAAAFLAVAIVYLLHASVDWMWESTAVTVLALAGVAVVGVRLSSRRVRLGLPLRAVLVTGAAVAAVVQFPGLISTLNIRSSQAAERAGNGGLALARARNAVSAQPWSASAHEQEALVLEAGRELGTAEHEETLAISDEPDNYAHWLIRSRIETELGELHAAARDYSRARQLRPQSLVFAYAAYFRTR